MIDAYRAYQNAPITPCGFCGSQNITLERDPVCALACEDCGAMGPWTLSNPQAAAVFWNRRPVPSGAWIPIGEQLPPQNTPLMLSFCAQVSFGHMERTLWWYVEGQDGPMHHIGELLNPAYQVCWQLKPAAPGAFMNIKEGSIDG